MHMHSLVGGARFGCSLSEDPALRFYIQEGKEPPLRLFISKKAAVWEPLPKALGHCSSRGWRVADRKFRASTSRNRELFVHDFFEVSGVPEFQRSLLLCSF
jgi:hypothetical protein